ncbi:MAG TPA: DUF4147 domain-containing protein [Gemmatimonadaceae bacterium]|nr:DUF4147 domain-containing protein [Gemmatimonadaceae bacterium]
MNDTDARRLLETLFHDTIAALQPSRAVHEALDGPQGAPSLHQAQRLHLVGLGKAATGMTKAALAWCDAHAVAVTGGIVITHAVADGLPPSIAACIGDHPVPGTRSLAAADRLAAYVDEQVHRGDTVLVLLSGGTSALIGAPRLGVSTDAYIEIARALLTSGLAIDDLNLLRRRLSRLGGGALGARLQERGASAQVLAMSDVIGDSLEAIGSGPCIRDRSTDVQVEAVVQRAHLDDATRTPLQQALHVVATQHGARRPADDIPHRIIGSSIVAQRHLSTQAALCGADMGHVQPAITGDAYAAGEAIAHEMLRHALALPARAHRAPLLVCCWGGEPTVALPTREVPPGGRMQALALAAARTLAAHPSAAAGITILAVGTDGRDGSTDAAGAIIDGTTWAAIIDAGRDPAADLAAHRSHDALHAAGALLPAFVSGINVNDLVIACVRH